MRKLIRGLGRLLYRPFSPDSLGRYGSVEIPGEATLRLPKGKIQLGHRRVLQRTPGLTVISTLRSVSITPAAGGPPVEIARGAFREYESRKLWIVSLGHIRVPQEGEYLVKTEGQRGSTPEHLVLG